VAFHDQPYDGQADAGAGELAGRVQPLERAEQLVGVGGIKTGAVIAHVAADGGICGRRRPELNERIVPAGRELPRVAQQVVHYHANEGTVGPYRDGTLDSEADVPFRINTLEFRGDLGGLGTEIDRAEVHLGPGEARKTQQVVDERRHMFRGGDDSLRVAPAILAENGAVIFQQGGTETAHRPERGAQVVGDRVRETLQVPVGRIEVVRPVENLGRGARVYLFGHVPGDRRRADQPAGLIVDG
jgi:hypothetical protein